MLAEILQNTSDGIVATGTISVGAAALSSIITYLTVRYHAQKTAVPQPCTIQQSDYQAQAKSNANDHSNMFARISRLEQISATLIERSISLDRQIDQIAKQIDTIYQKLI